MLGIWQRLVHSLWGAELERDAAAHRATVDRLDRALRDAARR